MKCSLNEVRTRALGLADLQRAFQSDILHAAHRTPPFIVDSPKASASERFAVYAEAYRLRLIEALAADYPALNEWLGDEAFDRLGRAYAGACHSGHFSIRWFGARLPGFLAENPAYRNQPALREMAAFEWALSEAFDAAESRLVTAAELAALPPTLWPMLQLDIHASLRTVQLAYNTPGRWRAWNRKEPAPDLETHSETTTWAIWRHELRLLFRRLPKAEARALELFREGICFAQVCEELCEWFDDAQVAANAAGYLQNWLQAGWITGIRTQRAPLNSGLPASIPTGERS